MDLALYMRVIWRFRWIVAFGFVLAAILASLSYVRISFPHGKPHVAYRLPQTWQSTETILITAKGAPWARIRGQSASVSGLAGLSSFYATVANSDPVQNRLKATGPVHGRMIAQAVADPTSAFRTPLPFVTIAGTAATPAEAVSIARRGGDALIGYVLSSQKGSDIPLVQRVRLAVLTEARPATLLAGRKKTLPIVIFVTIMVAVIGLAFILENLRPRVQAVDSGAKADDHLNRQTA